MSTRKIDIEWYELTTVRARAHHSMS